MNNSYQESYKLFAFVRSLLSAGMSEQIGIIAMFKVRRLKKMAEEKWTKVPFSLLISARSMLS
jgi:hypothetical protein